jgi:hypothetical protein
MLVVQVVLFAGCGGVVVACSGVLEAAQARNHLPARRQAVARTRAGGVSFLAFQAVMPFKFLSLHRSGIAGTTTLLGQLPDWHWGCSSAALLAYMPVRELMCRAFGIPGSALLARMNDC